MFGGQGFIVKKGAGIRGKIQAEKLLITGKAGHSL